MHHLVNIMNVFFLDCVHKIDGSHYFIGSNGYLNGNTKTGPNKTCYFGTLLQNKRFFYVRGGGTQENLCFGPFSCVLNLPHVAPIPPPGSNMLWSIAGVYLDAAGTVREGEAA